MKETRLLMGMPITIELVDVTATRDDLDKIFTYFAWVDETFSTYKPTSEISRINRGEVLPVDYSDAMNTILTLSEQTKRDTHGYFDIRRAGKYDPSGIVKGWAIQQAAIMLSAAGLRNFYVDAGGDIQVAGYKDDHPWRIGIRNPFKRTEYIKVLALTEEGIATSGTAIRGQHIYDPYHPDRPLEDIVSLTVIGANVYEADRFATAAFAMGRRGIQFLEKLAGVEAYMVDAQARATFTSGFERYVFQQ